MAVMAQRNYTPNSVLAAGSWYKIGVTQEGVYKIDLAFLNSLGINTSNLASASIRLYGNGAAMLPENNALPRADDLVENTIQVVDGGDGLFNNNDYLLFYAPGPQRWLKDSLSQRFQHQKNLYTDTAYYYISLGAGLGGKRIQTAMPILNANTTVNSYNERYFYENDLVNLLNSGKEWYGEAFSNGAADPLSRNFTVDFTGLVAGQSLTLMSSVANRTIGTPSNFTFTVNGNQVQHIDVPAISGYFLDPYAIETTQEDSFISNQSSLAITANFNATVVGAQGWLNWFELHGRKILSMQTKNQVFFRDWASVAHGNKANFILSNTMATTSIWDITQPLQPQNMPTIFAGSQTSFINDVSMLREYVAFNVTGLLVPTAIGMVVNQNLHHSTPVDLIIITDASMLSEAQRLASFHLQQDGFKSVVATTLQIFNEFSSGIPDPTALRDFVKMYYDKAGADTSLQPKYLLLLGAASFDYKNRINHNTNLVPCYESVNALDPLTTLTSDDFFGLLKDSDDVNTVAPPALLAIGIGRLPARSLTEATTMVDKIINYCSPQSLGPWRNQTVYVADDKDNDLHLNDAEIISADAAATNPLLNQSKIYLDAYPMVSGTSGSRYPEVNTAIVNKIVDGVLLFNYNGHGGYQRLSGSAILGPEELQQMNNPNKLPLFITATCDFAPYDDPTKNSMGGSLLYDGPTGAIALMTTTRVVFASSNLVINDNYVKQALQPDANGRYLTLGEAVKRTKNNTYLSYGDVYNNRKFVLLGDPAMKLAFPTMRIQLDSLNGHPMLGNDTLTALTKYVFTGLVTDALGNTLTGFNGTVYPTVFDKASLTNTLGNDPASPVTSFSQQTNVLYKGAATVQNGHFQFSFIMPKDINYQPGKGRISLYADNGNIDANGVFTNFYIGGAGNTAIADTVGPVIKAFINDRNFISGGITSQNNVLLAYLSDSLGINTVGTAIGHDITLVIDGDENNLVVLNSYYQATTNSYQQGQLSYQLPTLSEGWHSLTLKAWNVADYSGSATIRFKVIKQENLAIRNLFNYPNPFTTSTIFSFEHNQPGISLDITIQIVSENGQQVAQIKRTMVDPGNRSIAISWDAGKNLRKGIYFYRIIVSSINGGAVATDKLLLR